MASQTVQGWHPNPQLMQPQQHAPPPQGWTGSWPPGGNFALPPGYPGPPPMPGGAVAHPRWNAGIWQYNPHANMQNPQQPWAPGVGWFPPNFNPYKRVPKPPSPSYWNTKLSDNGLGLEGMVKRCARFLALAFAMDQARLYADQCSYCSWFFPFVGRNRQSIMARNHIRLGYGIRPACLKVVNGRRLPAISTFAGADPWIPTVHPRPHASMVRAVEGHRRMDRVLRRTLRHRRGGPGGAATFTMPKITRPPPRDHQDTVRIPLIRDPTRAQMA